MKPKSKLGMIIRGIVTLVVLCIIGRINNVNILLAINGYSVNNYKIVYYGFANRITDKKNMTYSPSLYNKPNPLEVIETSNSKNELCLIPIYKESGFWHIEDGFTNSFSKKNYALLQILRIYSDVRYYPPIDTIDLNTFYEKSWLESPGNEINGLYYEVITITCGVDAIKKIDIDDNELQKGETIAVQQDDNKYVVQITKYYHDDKGYSPTDIRSLLQTKGMVSNSVSNSASPN